MRFINVAWIACFMVIFFFACNPFHVDIAGSQNELQNVSRSIIRLDNGYATYPEAPGENNSSPTPRRVADTFETILNRMAGQPSVPDSLRQYWGYYPYSISVNNDISLYAFTVKSTTPVIDCYFVAYNKASKKYQPGR